MCPFPSWDGAVPPPLASALTEPRTTLTGAVLPPHGKPSLITKHDGKVVPDQSDRSERFELVSPPLISEVDKGGGNGHVNAHAQWTDFVGFDPRFSVSQTDPKRTRELEQGQEQAQASLLM